MVTLFLAVGMLRRHDGQTSEEARLAPIPLLPAVLTRPGVGRRISLSAAPAEPEVNPSLLRKLKVDFGVEPKLPENGESLDPDSSQQTAIEAVRQGSDLVLQGPPRTGKSQTIANLVSESLADGKTVLFVSEKMAALASFRFIGE